MVRNHTVSDPAECSKRKGKKKPAVAKRLTAFLISHDSFALILMGDLIIAASNKEIGERIEVGKKNGVEVEGKKRGYEITVSWLARENGHGRSERDHKSHRHKLEQEFPCTLLLLPSLCV
ncbi:hypothetical protein CR513_20311, partial [Mucuna pruriens]